MCLHMIKTLSFRLKLDLLVKEIDGRGPQHNISLLVNAIHKKNGDAFHNAENCAADNNGNENIFWLLFSWFMPFV